MDFISNKKPQIDEMLRFLNASGIDDLFADIPASLRIPSVAADDGLSELEGMQFIESLSGKNTFPSLTHYLGGGAYDHHIPALVASITSKGEFLTSYTPYQAEASQGMLQAIFEYQTAICNLTGMDVSNASVYDGAAACTEGVLMALREKKGRTKILISRGLHPFYRAVVETAVKSHSIQIIDIPLCPDDSLDANALSSHLDKDVAAVLLQSPNTLGVIEEIGSATPLIHAAGALVILCANPLSYGLFASAGELGADIAVGDAQPFGLPLHFGGPYAGYLACKEALMRQIPGRIVGETTDKDNRRGFVLTLQAREQHIRREKATSNICTNQALAALAVLITLLWYGPKGLKQLALTNFQRTEYLKAHLSEMSFVSISDAPTFNEFVLSFQQPIDTVLTAFRSQGIEPGIPLDTLYPDRPNALLVNVTEKKSKEDLDRYIAILNALQTRSHG